MKSIDSEWIYISEPNDLEALSIQVKISQIREQPYPDPDCENYWQAAVFSVRILIEQIWVLAISSPEFQGLLDLDPRELCPLWIQKNWNKIGEV